MAIHITGDDARRRGPLRQPVRAPGRDDARPAVPDGARVPRPGQGAGPVRQHRPGRDRGGRPGGVQGAVLDPAGDPPVPRVDGRSGCRPWPRSSRSGTTVTPSGSGPRPPSGADLLQRLMALPGFGRQKAQIFAALAGQAARRTPRRVGGGGRGLRPARLPVGGRRDRPGLAAEGARVQAGEEASGEGGPGPDVRGRPPPGVPAASWMRPGPWQNDQCGS